MSAQQVRIIRVFVSSPGDMASARACVDEVLERINRDPAVAAQARLEAWKWETHAVPQLGPTAQEAIDWQTPPFEIYLGLMSARFGTATEKSGSGTEQEFQQALQQWQTTRRPWILFYFDENAKPGTSPADARQWLSVCEFRTKLQNLGPFGTYRGVHRGKNSLVAKLEQHLRQVVHELLRAPSPALPRNAAGTPSVSDAYRRWLQGECGEMQLLGLRPKHGHAVRLNHVYVPLTTGPEALPEYASEEMELDEPRQMLGRRQRKHLLLELLDQKSLYVSGDAGTGKSTFCRWVGYLACAGQLPEHAVPPPENYQERFPESLRDRLPVLVRLREFWQHLPTKPNCRELTQAELEASLDRWLRATRPGELTWDIVAAHLAQGSALLVLDGVDEIPLAHGGDDQECWPRQMLLAGFAAAVSDWHQRGNRVLLTSRPYGLADREAESLGLAPAHIDPLDEALQQLLARRWFQLLSERPENPEAGAAEAAAMLRDARGREGLDQLVANPMLLTATCVVYNEGKRLPQDKYDLYARVVENVLYNRYDDPARIERVHGHLAAIAYAMHTGKWLGEPRRGPQAAADYEELRRILTCYREQNPETDHGLADVVDTRERLLSRTGLLLPRGDRQAAFYHLSIQEFLAAQRLVLIECDSEDALLGALLTHGSEAAWRNTLSFAFGCYLDKYKLSSQKGIRLVERIVETVVGGESGRTAFPGRRDGPKERFYQEDGSGEPSYAGKLVAGHQNLLVVAADALEMLLGKKLQLPAQLQERFREIGLAAIAEEIPAKPRWTLTTVLGRLGDPRVAVDLRIGQHPEEHPGYVRVPAGKYFYGDEKEPFTINEPFLLSRYPVTNSQFAVFLEDGGYGERRWWSEDGWRWLQEERVGEPLYWRDAKWNAPNEPVVGVSFWEAEAFAKWAGGCLPTERQWEAAARGPKGLVYPWGEEWEDGICNSGDAGLNVTSPVGMFPRSNSAAFGLEDMAGNVLEWCTEESGEVRVLRGGCSGGNSGFCRAAYRNRFNPVLRNNLVGCRLCCCFSSGLK